MGKGVHDDSGYKIGITGDNGYGYGIGGIQDIVVYRMAGHTG